MNKLLKKKKEKKEDKKGFLIKNSRKCRGVFISWVCRPGPTNFWFDHSAVCNKLCVVGVS